ncbi:sensor histidine kinase [Rhodocyclus tenuis]|uniref:Signal transduction histidine kinase n=1 Tax=Rhodocyclus tenuis TaxID=1066 RepID=A0A840G696_RHOTE|nr:sensor histidine kinase [Rhodocyclus tenuis]MBB4247405.1 signal transduction histidine kinase [Rhodocyclus tenuis]
MRKNLSVVRNALARPVKLIGQIEDISGLKEAQSAAFSRSLVAAQEAERKRIAHELHDEIGQSLTALKITLGRARKVVSEPSAQESLDHAQWIISSLMNEIRGIAHRLRPPELDQLGLTATLRTYLEKTLRAGDVKISFTSDVGDARFSPDIELCCFRVTQEAATNCLRHAAARRFEVELRLESERLCLTIRDDGAGFDLAAQKDSGSLGLIGMRERVKAVGGKLVINSCPRLGTEILARFPIRFFTGVPIAGASS